MHSEVEKKRNGDQKPQRELGNRSADALVRSSCLPSNRWEPDGGQETLGMSPACEEQRPSWKMMGDEV